jgi:lipopolysaccharide/colanic/teichoic acid biosynthesis glycosyltransferase
MLAFRADVNDPERSAVSLGKRLLDIVLAGGALLAATPLLLIAAIGIKLTSPGPVFYRARRIGRDLRRSRIDTRTAADKVERRRHDAYRGREFTMYKFRTMRVDSGQNSSPITAARDSRVFPFGAFLRATKIDELPQLLNVLNGDMSLVGPRPEAPEIVRAHYTPADITTLQVPPGMTSPGTVYYYTHGESTLPADATVDQYVTRLLPVKLSLDRVYIERRRPLYDVRVLVRTAFAILARILRVRRFPLPPELAETNVSAARTAADTLHAGRQSER